MDEFWKDGNGKQYYVAAMHPQVARLYGQYTAEDSARLAALAAGKNWRRAKREARKAGLAWKKANPASPAHG